MNTRVGRECGKELNFGVLSWRKLRYVFQVNFCSLSPDGFLRNARLSSLHRCERVRETCQGKSLEVVRAGFHCLMSY